MSPSKISLAALLATGLLTTVACDSEKPAEPQKTAKVDKKAVVKTDKKADKKADAPKDVKDVKDAAKDAPKDAAKTDDAAKDAEPGGGGGTDTSSVPAGGAGPAYFAVDDHGVFMLDGGEFKAVAKGPDKLVRSMQVGADGKAYLLGSDGIMHLDGAAAKVVAKTSYKTTGSVDSFAVTKDGKFWAASYKGVSYFDGKKWKVEEKTTLGADVKLLRGIGLDKDGNVWVASSNKLHVKQGDAWKDIDVSKVSKNKPFFDQLVFDPKSQALFAPTSSLVIKVSAIDKLEDMKVPKKGFSSFGMLSFANNGIAALKTSHDSVARLVDGKATTFEMKKDFPGRRVHALSVDGQGRVWVATDIGISIIGPGAERAKWMSGSVVELAGRIKGILIIGAGPELPTVGAVKKAGVKGKVLVNDKPLATAEVELCPEPGGFSKKSPCEDSLTKFAAKTDADGNFEFADVPLGAYGLAAKVGEKWHTTFAGAYGGKMKEGATLDIGKVKFTAKDKK